MTAPYNPQAFVPATPEPVDHRTALVNELEANLSKLPERDQGFAKSLISAFRKYGSLSDKQGYWVVTLADRAQAVLAAETAPATPVEPPKTQLAAGYHQVFELFQIALSHGLKFPKIRLETEKGQKVVLKRFGPGSRYKGEICITDNGQSFETRQYFGRITSEGQFIKAQAATDDVTQLLQALAEDPVHLATAQGHRTSRCCFCNRELETRESVTVGYGPICADKFGLPWGDQAETTFTRIKLEG